MSALHIVPGAAVYVLLFFGKCDDIVSLTFVEDLPRFEARVRDSSQPARFRRMEAYRYGKVENTAGQRMTPFVMYFQMPLDDDVAVEVILLRMVDICNRHVCLRMRVRSGSAV